MIGSSTDWAARFASPEVLRRAWFSLSLTDVFCRVQIRMSNVSTRWTLEATPIPSSVLATLTTLLARILWVNFLDTNARFLSLVVDLLPRVNAGESRTLGYWGLRVTRRLLPVGIRESG